MILQAENCFFLGGNVFFVCFFLLTYFGCPEVITPEKWSYILHLTYNRVFRGPILVRNAALEKGEVPHIVGFEGIHGGSEKWPGKSGAEGSGR